MKEKHFNYKHGKYCKGYQNHCIDCGCNIAIKSIRCNVCNGKFRTGKKHHNYKTGKYTEEMTSNHFCVDCAKKISPNAERCVNCANKMINQNPKTKAKLRMALIGKNSPLYNPEKHKQHYCKECGNKISYKAYKNTCLCMPCSHKGNKNSNWKRGITPLPSKIRKLPEYINWRNQVFKRDNYTCQECNKRGGNLESHHIKEFFILFQEFLNKYKQYNLTKDKKILFSLTKSYKPFWKLNNGKTLCKQCHNKQHSNKE